MPKQSRKSSPILGAAGNAIENASHALVSGLSEFSHSFEVDMEKVRPDAEQPRRAFDEAAIASLAETLRNQGQLQPILVRRDANDKGRWVIVAGERRWRAAKLIGWSKMLAMAYEGDPDIAMLLENLQRVDLSPLEEANGIRRLVTEKGWTQEQAAHALGKSKGDVSGTLRILKIPREILAEVLTSEHPPAKNVLIELSRLDDRGTLVKLAGMARAGTLTVKAVRGVRVKHSTTGVLRSVNERPAGWSTVTKAAKLVAQLSVSELAISSREAEVLQKLRDAIEVTLSRMDGRR